MNYYEINKISIEDALQFISNMIIKTEKAKEKFTEGTSQYSLLKNRLNALNIGCYLIKEEINKTKLLNYTKKDFNNALKPILSLINKSEKAKEKLSKTCWQYKMLENNLKTLYIIKTLFLNNIN